MSKLCGVRAYIMYRQKACGASCFVGAHASVYETQNLLAHLVALQFVTLAAVERVNRYDASRQKLLKLQQVRQYVTSNPQHTTSLKHS